MLFLNNLSFCVACNSNLAIAIFVLSFFANNCCSFASSNALNAPLPAPLLFLLAPALLRDSLPSCNSAFAISDCSRRSSLSRWLSTRVRSVWTSGWISETRALWAVVRSCSPRSSKC